MAGDSPRAPACESVMHQVLLRSPVSARAAILGHDLAAATGDQRTQRSRFWADGQRTHATAVRRHPGRGDAEPRLVRVGKLETVMSPHGGMLHGPLDRTPSDQQMVTVAIAVRRGSWFAGKAAGTVDGKRACARRLLEASGDLETL